MDYQNNSISKLETALARIGVSEQARPKMISALREVEDCLMDIDFDARLELVAPVLDALHRDVHILEKKVRIEPELPVLHFKYYYRSAIARGLVLSRPEISDHVWEPQTTRLFLHLVRGASAVAIGGAYFGDHALLAGQMLQFSENTRTARVHCFEMNSEQLDLCRVNARENKVSNLVFHHKALYSRSGVHLGLTGDDAAACAHEVSPNTDDAVPAVTLQEVAQEHGLDSFQVIMLDIEGGELEALKGGEAFLTLPPGQAPDIIFEVHRHYMDWSAGLDNTDIVRYLRSYGYHVFAVRDYQSNVDLRGYPVELVSPETAYLQGPPHGFNMVAVKRVSRLQGPQFRFVEHVSPKLLFHRDPALHAPLVRSEAPRE
ncbi:methyltransferase FkbM family [Desulfonatronospira thiodismutans ASO3-1]|uniref:Methyltransferase FkbM family n=1 Tax=Desulfonatronospira thiodismutans ASO3-1 TaxID=555779 RepID=D6SN89_9BACT|nr:FkbM family methyltransferase [Desulfonatronospira thiodismutans]EFI34215.1 methyltransferase FkbM family [Desulfonatronospira thiodismutans ASO3-1]